MRRLGVYGENLPTKKERSVTQSDFSIAGLFGSFNRKYHKPFRFRSTQEALEVLGEQTDPADYGWDAVDGFFANLQGQSGSIIVCSYPGVGATQAKAEAAYQGNPLLRFRAAYKGEPEYGAYANRVAFEIIRGSAFTTPIIRADTDTITLESVAGIRKRDVVALGVPSTLISHEVIDKITIPVNRADHTVRRIFLNTIKLDSVHRFVLGAVEINGETRTISEIDGLYAVIDSIAGINSGDEVKKSITHTVVSVDDSTTLTMDNVEGWSAGDTVLINGVSHGIVSIADGQVIIDDTTGISPNDTGTITLSHIIQAVYDNAAEFDSVADWNVGNTIIFPGAEPAITAIDGLVITFTSITGISAGDTGSYTIAPETYWIQVDTAAGISIGDTVLGQKVLDIDGTLLKTADTTSIAVGDTFETGNAASWQYAQVIDINESESIIQIQHPVTTAIGGEAAVVAYQVKTYFRNEKGVVAEVNKDLGKRWLTLNTEDADRYMPAVFKLSSYFDIEQLGESPIDAIDSAPLTYLAGGSNGKRPTAITQFRDIWRLMDNQPFRMIAAVETSNSDIQKSLEEYCANREDNPMVIYVGEFGMDAKEKVVAAGQAFQRSNEVDAVFVHNWLGVSDPFASSPTAPRRFVPAAGHLMGQWIHSIGRYGIHCIPARKTIPLLGASEVAGYSAVNDFDRTDLADAGANVIQRMDGRGLITRNFFTSSTAVEFRFANAVIMRNFVKLSIVESLQESENQPNVIARVREDRMASVQFMHKLWLRGSTGNVPEGETFGQYEKEDGSVSTEEDAYEIIADASNNSVGQLQAGERNMEVYFMFPAPAGSIRIGVGLMYKVN